MSEDMTKVALKTRLRAWFYSYRDNEGIIQMDKDAHNQIHKLIEQSEARQPNADEVREIIELLRKKFVCDDFPYHKICDSTCGDAEDCKRITQFLLQSKVVTRAQLIALHDKYVGKITMPPIATLIFLLLELDIEVVEK